MSRCWRIKWWRRRQQHQLRQLPPGAGDRLLPENTLQQKIRLRILLSRYQAKLRYK